MYYKTIELLPKEISIDNKIVDLIWQFVYILECNGQILKDYKVIKNKNYRLYVTTPKKDSLSEKYDSIYVKSVREKVLEYFTLSEEDIGVNIESQEYCSCANRDAIEMQTYNTDIDSVFTCCNCGKPIALYELPYPENSADYSDVLTWQQNYSAIDTLWLNCISDRYTGNQRVNFDSAVNKQGIEIAKYLSKRLGYPVYYHLSCDYGKKIKVEKVGNKQIHVCPKCGNVMKRVEFSNNCKIDVCENCALSYDFDDDVI
ncbi:MAG: DUF2310 family Zn-ribbon-containing protein [Clostridia bacterium]|nr:DUF2310 family Zn-ribbon-containing protein [Clostridia bacterium]